MQPYLGGKRGGREANCGNGSHIEAVVKRRLRLRLQIAHGLALWSIYHPSQAFQTNSLSCCHPSAPCRNKCFGIFVLPANEHAGQDQAAEVVKHPVLFWPFDWLSIFNDVKYLEQLDKMETGRPRHQRLSLEKLCWLSARNAPRGWINESFSRPNFSWFNRRR